MTGETFSLVVSAAVSILTIFGVQIVNAIAKKNEYASKIQGREFDDGIERRKELIREIDGYKAVILEKDKQIFESTQRIETLKDKIQQLTIDYVKLESQYDDAVGDLAQFSEDLAKKFRSKVTTI